ncbi:hypothetical protein GCM10025860_17550 [Methanobacterium ferruginis]|nr:hypothetical protein GCM10025860_17550 [Methanobacterium ferruginis]
MCFVISALEASLKLFTPSISPERSRIATPTVSPGSRPTIIPFWSLRVVDPLKLKISSLLNSLKF